MKRIAILIVAFGALVFGAAQAMAKDITVGNNPSTCKKADYPTIQQAVTAASPGDTIKVCPGVYQEWVTIPATKNHLNLESQKPLAAIIKAPQAPPALNPKGDIVHVEGAKDVSLKAFTISGPLPDYLFCNDFPLSGVRVDGNGSATLEKNRITQIRSTSDALRGCQNGLAVVIGRQAEGEVGQATLKENTIDLYQKEGVYVDGSGSYLRAENNTIGNPAGDPDSAITAPNGIQIGRGATADVRNNNIFGNVYTGSDSAGTGIIFFSQNGGVTIENNNVFQNDIGVETDSGNGGRVSNNDVHDNTSDGIELCGLAIYGCDPIAGVDVRDNKVHDNKGSGIFLFGNAHDNLVRNNQLKNNGTAGGDTTDGLRLDAQTTNNHLENNHMQESTTHDCHDDSTGSGTSGTANFWVGDEGATQNRDALCRHAVTT